MQGRDFMFVISALYKLKAVQFFFLRACCAVSIVCVLMSLITLVKFRAIFSGLLGGPESKVRMRCLAAHIFEKSRLICMIFGTDKKINQ